MIVIDGLMMRNAFIVLISVVAMILASCETYEPPFYEGPEFINFQDSATSIREDEGLAKLRVNLGGKLSNGPVTVKYSVVANDNAVALYKIKNEGSVVIPGGQGYAEIEITPVNNDLPDGEKIVELNIYSVEGGPYTIGFPGPDALNSVLKVNIVDDDCALDRSFITGPVVETSRRIVEEGEEQPSPDITNVVITEDTNSKVIVINDFWGISGGILKVYLDACPGEAFVYDSDIVVSISGLGLVEIIPTGTGIFDQESGILSLELSLDSDEGSFGTYNFVYKK
jgi:hypothetical protein